jgi:hypothetical protein
MQLNNDIELLDSIKTGFGLTSDAELAAFLGVTRGNVSIVRNRNGKLGPLARIKCLDKLAFLGIRNWLERISTEYISKRLNEISKTQARNVAYTTLSKEFNLPSDEDLPDRIREALGMSSDLELAEVLGIRPTSISMVRKGKSKLGHIPRLKLLEIVEGLPSSEILLAITDNKFLINLIARNK